MTTRTVTSGQRFLSRSIDERNSNRCFCSGVSRHAFGASSILARNSQNLTSRYLHWPERVYCRTALPATYFPPVLSSTLVQRYRQVFHWLEHLIHLWRREEEERLDASPSIVDSRLETLLVASRRILFNEGMRFEARIVRAIDMEWVCVVLLLRHRFCSPSATENRRTCRKQVRRRHRM